MDHRKGALFGSASAVVLGVALLATGGVGPAAAACVGNFTTNVTCNGLSGPATSNLLFDSTVTAFNADIGSNILGVSITTGLGDDQVFVTNSDLDGDIYTSYGDDLIVVNALSFLPQDNVNIESIYGASGDDTIVLNSFGPGADIYVDGIYGDRGLTGPDGNDQIYLNAGFGGEIRVYDGIEGNGGNDVIDLDAFRGGEIHLYDDISGGSGNDDISATATRGGLIRGEDIWGGTGNDDITLRADRGGVVDFDELGGGDGNDDIGAFASRGGRIEIDQGISGGDGYDDILLGATTNGQVILSDDISGGSQDDDIGAFASRGGLIRGEDIWGDSGNDDIVLWADRGGVVDFDEIGGGSGNDDIAAFATRGGRVEIDQGISGGTGYDDILLLADRGGDIVVGDDIGGGDQNDDIALVASRGGNINVDGDVDGDNGDDDIALIAFDGGDIYVDDSVQGGDGNDRILLFATDRRSDIEVDDDVEGGNGNDDIALVATRGAEIRVNDDVEGNDGYDDIALIADRGGRIYVDGEVSGGDESDDIFLLADRGGLIDIDQGISGGNGYDDILLRADRGGDIVVGDDISGGDQNDDIALVASRGGNINVDGDVDGDNGNDDIALIAFDGGDIYVDDSVQGGDGNDRILLLATDWRSDIEVDEDVEGGDGNDDIALIATRGAEIRVNDDVEGNDGYDDIALIADRGGSIYVDGEVRGGDDSDDIFLLADRGGNLDIDRDVEGGSGNDDIFVMADRGGDVDLEQDVEGGSGHDDIFLFANRGGDIHVGGDVSGDSGNDDITLLALNGGDIEVDGDVEGGSGNDDIVIAAFNTNSITIGEDIEGDSGNDDLFLVNLDNVGFVQNFHFNGEVDGGTGFDRMFVAADSDLQLNEVEHWQQLFVVGNSRLNLTGDDYSFNWSNGQGLVYVDGTSVLRLSDQYADLVTDTFVLGSGAGYNGEALEVGDQYDPLSNPGGVLDLTYTGPAFVEIGSNSNPVQFVNYGTVNMHDGYAADTLVVRGNYEGYGNLAIDTVLGDSSSPTDKLRVTGDIEPDTGTTVYVSNAAPGHGAFTGLGDQDGIKIVDSSGPANSAPDAFYLGTNNVTGVREVTDGAYSYRLFQSQTDGDWYLRSDLVEGAGTYATVSSAAQRHFYAGFDTLYKRLGELKQQDALEGRNADLATKAPVYVPAPAPKFQIWGRGGGADLSYDVDSGWDFDQTTYGLQIGADYTFDYNTSRISVGAFGGYGWSSADVHDHIFYSYKTTNLDIDGWNAGIYATVREVGGVPGVGFYGDFVGKVDVLDVDMSGDVDRDGHTFKASTDAVAWGGSVELGYGFDVGNNVVLQPQGQLTYTSVNQDSYLASNGIYVSPDDADSLIGRLGLQLQTTVTAENGTVVTPWAVFNVLSEFLGDNDTNVAGTVLTSDIGGTWYNAGLGFNASITDTVALYGSGEYNFGDVEGWAGTAGIKFRW